MFDRFIRLARAKKALQEARFEDAVQLAADPLIRDDRRAEDVRRAAMAALLHRGRERLHAGDAAAAVRDLQRVVAQGPDSAADALLAAARDRIADEGRQRETGQRALDEGRRAAERGDLQVARQAVQSWLDDSRLAPAAQGLQAFVVARQGRAAELAAQCERHLDAGRVDAAIEDFRGAKACDVASADALVSRLLRPAADRHRAAVGERLRAGDRLGALTEHRRRLLALPELANERANAAVATDLVADLLKHLRTTSRPELDLELLQACAAEPVLPGDGALLQTVARQLTQLASARTGGRIAELAGLLAQLGSELGRKDWQAESEGLRRQEEAAAERLKRARELAAGGSIAAARAELGAILQDLPLHDEARRELEVVERSAREREQRLETARQAAKAGRLREAYAVALTLAQPGSAGDDARLFAQELRARMDLVARGLDQVRAALHGRTSGAVAGLRHCLLRLDELAKVQSDDEDLPLLQKSLQHEIDGIELAEQAMAAVARGQYGQASDVVVRLVEQRAGLLAPDRLDARILELADRLAAGAGTALAAGRLLELDRCLIGLLAAGAVRPDLAVQVEQLRRDAVSRQEKATALAEEAVALLAARDLTAAESRCEAARQLWIDGPAVRKVEEELAVVRLQQARLERVEAMAKDGDVDGAHAELHGMPPTSPLLRTRIYDMKQSLARAQGLEGNFLLRVDEGGEFLCARGDSLSIGNLRDGRADLPILAAISGRHARVQRSMSFHGGMQDSIVAEGGELRVGGQRVEQHKLRPGDRVQLGAALQVAYGQPSRRSLTSSLQLLGGFQVAGTDRVLLFKDRGRDGRILIGPGQDVHVRVGAAKAEVELFATKTGQMRVRCETGGDIDGRPFKDEHPVDAGATVRAAGISFVLQPWVRPA